MHNKIETVRLYNAKTLAKKYLTLADFADAIDRSATQVSRLMGKNPTKIIGGRLARHIETCLDLDDGWMDFDRSKSSNASSTSNADRYPLLTHEQVLMRDQLLETQFEMYSCPIKCSSKTFIIKITGLSMSPTFLTGSMIWVDPIKTAKNNSYVLASKGQKITFKQLIIEDDITMLTPSNPSWPNQHTLLTDDHKIIGVVVFAGWAT